MRASALLLLVYIAACTGAGTTTRTATLDLDSRIIEYEVAGEGEPIVWIHGGGVDRHMWRPQLDRFARTHRVIAYDLRGHGASTFRENAEPDVADLVALLDALGLDRAHVVGLSLGAIVALDFALAYPDRLTSLVLMSPGLVGVQERDPSYLEPIIEIGQALAIDDVESALEVIERITFLGQRSSVPAGLDSARAYVARAARAHVARGNHTRIPRFAEADPASRLAEVRVPTLLLHGLADLPYIAGNVQVLAEGIPDARVVAWPEAGHMLNVERVDEVNRELETFLTGVSGPPGGG